MLVTTKSILKKAQKGKYAVGAFNTSNLEMTKAIIQAGIKLKSPLIIQTSQKAIAYAGLEQISNIIKTAAAAASIPIALHLDHGRDMNLIKKCIKIGYTSIMIDASKYDLGKNISTTKSVVKLTKVPVEAEIGMLQNTKDVFTNPAEAKVFAQETGISSLAIAIGTSHGAFKFKGTPKLDLERLTKIKNLVKIPLVLHGASAVPKKYVNLANKFGAKLQHMQGVPDSQIRKAVKRGICKINIDTDLRLSFNAGIRKFVKQNPKVFDPRAMISAGTNEIQNLVEYKIKLFGSKNKA